MSGGTHKAPRSHRARVRRAHTLGGAFGVTLFGAVIPGAGVAWTGRRWGYLLTVPAICAAIYVGFVSDKAKGLVEFAFDPARLRIAAIVLGVVFAIWAGSVVLTYWLARPSNLPLARVRIGGAVVATLCLVAGLPVVQSMRYAMTQADLVDTVFTSNETATTPKNVTVEDPWGGQERVNVLVLGGDGGIDRTGVRTDTVILVSMNTRTGRSVMFSLPRNMMNAQFPKNSPLHDKFPYGFNGAGSPGNWMLNAVYGQVPALYPGILGKSKNEGADALKQAVGGSLGLRVDYYILVNLDGFKQIVDAMGGVTVNVNEPVAINGNTDAGIPPTDYLDPGPNQHLDGFHALWFARGRWGSDDYERMLRQRCMVDALIDAADPVTLLRRYQGLAKAGKQIVRTDVPKKLLPAFVGLASEVKEHQVKSIAFVSSEKFSSADPDFEWLQASVRNALKDKKKPQSEGGTVNAETDPGAGTDSDTTTDAATDPGNAVKVNQSCAYDPAA